MRLANLLVDGDRVTLIDFDDCGFGWFVYDFAAAISFYEDRPNVAALRESWIAGYTKVMDANVMTVMLSADNRVFFNVDNGPDTILHFRPKILAEMGKRYNIEFTPDELRKFEKSNMAFGVPIQQMKAYLAAGNVKDKETLETKGIPIDSADNQLALWILFSRQINPAVNTLIKGDANVDYPVVKKVLDILQDKNVNRFNLITNLEAVKVEQEITE